MSKARDIADLDFNSPDIDGGNIDGAVIGATTAAAGSFTTVDASGQVTVSANTPHIRLVESDDANTYSTIEQNFGYLTISNDAGNAGSGDGIIYKVDGEEVFRMNPGGNSSMKGDLQLDSSNAEINLKQGVGGTTGGINWTFNTDSSNFASVKLDYDSRATTGLHIDSGYPITLDYSVSGDDGLRMSASGVMHNRFNSSGALFNSPQSSNLDFKVRSANNQNMLFVDAGEDVVAIGTTDTSGDHPDASLNVYGGITFVERTSASEGSQPAITQWSTDGTAQDLVIGTRSGTGKVLIYTGNAGAGGDWGDLSNLSALTLNSSQNAIFGGNIEFSAIATHASMDNVSISIPDRQASLYNVGDRGNITIQASSSTSGSQALSGGRVLINAGNSNNGQTGDVVISTGVNILNSNDKGNVRFNIGGRTSSEEVAKIDRFGLEVSGRKLCNSDNSAPSGVSGGLVYSTPAYDEYHYVYSGNQTRTLDLVCGSYFMAEITYTSHQTNGGADIHRHIKGKWANNHQTHTFVNYNDSGNTNAISLTITATDQYGGSNDASGRLRIRQTYSSGSYAGTRVIVRVYYGAISSATMSSV